MDIYLLLCGIMRVRIFNQITVYLLPDGPYTYACAYYWHMESGCRQYPIDKDDIHNSIPTGPLVQLFTFLSSRTKYYFIIISSQVLHTPQIGIEIYSNKCPIHRHTRQSTFQMYTYTISFSSARTDHTPITTVSHTLHIPILTVQTQNTLTIRYFIMRYVSKLPSSVLIRSAL